MPARWRLANVMPFAQIYFKMCRFRKKLRGRAFEDPKDIYWVNIYTRGYQKIGYAENEG
jgi:hypothetical protein